MINLSLRKLPTAAAFGFALMFLADGARAAVTPSMVSGFIPFGSYFGGCGTAIAAGNPPWVIGCSQVDAQGDAGIYKWDTQGWAQYPGAAVSIALSPTGVAWVVNASGGIYRWDGTNWEDKVGCAKSIGVGGNDAAWVIGCDVEYTEAAGVDYGVYRWTGKAWQQVSGAARVVAVSPEGRPWVLTAGGSVYRWNETNFAPFAAPCAKDIAVGANDAAWIIGCQTAGAGGNYIYGWDGSSWIAVPGEATRISVDSSPTGNGVPWVLDAQGTIYWAEYPIPPN